MNKKPLIIIGINDSHDASASIVIDGKLIAAVSEERLQRIKSMGGFPKGAIEECLRIAGVKKEEVDYVAVGSKHVSVDNLYNIVPTLTIKDLYKLEEEYWQPTLYQNKKIKLKDIFPNYKPKGTIYYPLQKIPFGFNRDLKESDIKRAAEIRKNYIAEYFALPSEKIFFIDHHTAHAYYSYYSNPFRNQNKKTLVLTSDAGGDGIYESISIFENGKYNEIYKGHSNTLAPIYSYITLLLGMKPNEHEYKVMGLAPYAKAHEKKGPYEVFQNALEVDGLQFKNNPEMKDRFKYFGDRLKFYRFDGIAGGLQDFAEKLRAVLRLDPDVVMIGEIRDQDTARTSLQAALTGHLVLTTYHASSAAAALTRMLDAIGINPLFASAIHLIMAQRLIRRLDDATKQPYKPDEALKTQLKSVIDSLPPNIPRPDLNQITLYKPGSSSANPFGYNGQIAIREQLLMTPGVQQLLRLPPNQITTEILQAKAVEEGMRTMLHDGLLKAFAGLTTLQEVYRVVG